ncbi:hypothetical protein M405DRAFT_822756 [Rhizopogon salebrosus TDB-379]|nr:hypothetical protein M405DRAFT_822756 [Rhizopogon salebrosus TDB-379]
MYEISFRMISTGGEHPSAYRSRLFKGEVASDGDVQLHSTMVTILGDRLALYVRVDILSENEEIHPCLMLHVWDWYKGDQPDDICVLDDGYFLNDIRFLTKEKLLCLTSHTVIELYNVEDLSEAPQLEARFTLPVSSQTLRFEYPSTFHSAASCARVVEPDEQ